MREGRDLNDGRCLDPAPALDAFAGSRVVWWVFGFARGVRVSSELPYATRAATKRHPIPVSSRGRPAHAATPLDSNGSADPRASFTNRAEDRSQPGAHLERGRHGDVTSSLLEETREVRELLCGS